MPARQALLCVDMQNDFVLPDAILCVKGAMGCLPHVIEAVEVARRSSVPVVWVVREHHPSGLDVEPYRALLFQNGGKGVCTQGTDGAQLVEGLEARPDELVVVKKRFSAFMGTTLDLALRRSGVERVVVCGVQTPNCIRATAFDAVCLDYPKVTVLSDATASATPEVQEANLFDLRKINVDTPSVADWAAQLGAAQQ